MRRATSVLTEKLDTNSEFQSTRCMRRATKDVAITQGTKLIYATLLISVFAVYLKNNLEIRKGSYTIFP
jgi:hypothetical protein